MKNPCLSHCSFYVIKRSNFHVTLSQPKLPNIKEDHQVIAGVFETKRCPSCTWDTLLMILKSPAVNNESHLSELTTTHVQTTSSIISHD